MSKPTVSRRTVLKSAALASAAPAAFHIVPRHCLGGPDHVAPSDSFSAALIGCGGRGPGTVAEQIKQFKAASSDLKVIAYCDVDEPRAIGHVKAAAAKGQEAASCADFRRVLERKDIDLVCIATPPHWHALISIAAAEAGKDVLCEKPLTRTIGEGRAVVRAFQRYGRILQVGTFGRLGASHNKDTLTTHKIMSSGLLKDCPAVVIKRDGFKVREWAGKPNLKPTDPPKHLDWNMYCGPAPLKPFVSERWGGTHRNYWDYEGGGLSDMGQHYFDPINWTYAKDDTSPVAIEASAPPAHPEVTGMWAWVELKYADGLTLVMDSGEWGSRYDRKQSRGLSLNDLSKEDQAKIAAMPDPEPLRTFAEAVQQRKPAAGNPEAAHRTATVLHLANIAIRVGRKIRYDPVAEQILDDDEANRLVYQPMRAPWHL
jgi:predicted dehydrogenase